MLRYPRVFWIASCRDGVRFWIGHDEDVRHGRKSEPKPPSLNAVAPVISPSPLQGPTRRSSSLPEGVIGLVEPVFSNRAEEIELERVVERLGLMLHP